MWLVSHWPRICEREVSSVRCTHIGAQGTGHSMHGSQYTVHLFRIVMFLKITHMANSEIYYCAASPDLRRRPDHACCTYTHSNPSFLFPLAAFIQQTSNRTSQGKRRRNGAKIPWRPLQLPCLLWPTMMPSDPQSLGTSSPAHPAGNRVRGKRFYCIRPRQSGHRPRVRA